MTGEVLNVIGSLYVIICVAFATITFGGLIVQGLRCDKDEKMTRSGGNRKQVG